MSASQAAMSIEITDAKMQKRIHRLNRAQTVKAKSFQTGARTLCTYCPPIFPRGSYHPHVLVEIHPPGITGGGMVPRTGDGTPSRLSTTITPCPILARLTPHPLSPVSAHHYRGTHHSACSLHHSLTLESHSTRLSPLLHSSALQPTRPCSHTLDAAGASLSDHDPERSFTSPRLRIPTILVPIARGRL